jgi:uncharacterized protein YdeI (YjbR/CyaY-like superfamily)
MAVGRVPSRGVSLGPRNTASSRIAKAKSILPMQSHVLDLTELPIIKGIFALRYGLPSRLAGGKSWQRTTTFLKMYKTNPKVEFYFTKAEKWRKEFEKMRKIILDCGLAEELKWGHPCYTSQDTNIVIIQGFKEYCAILFTKGALLKDPKRILIQQTENVQAARQARFTTLQQIVKLEKVLKAYIKEAIKAEKAGLQVPYKKTSEFKVAAEFQKRLDEDSALRSAFEKLTPGRQRGYLLYFSGAKQSETRESRIEKCIPLIFDGIGLNDK